MIREFKYKGTKISYSDEGTGKVLVYIHGFLEEKSMWTSLITNFKSKYRCISIDLFGHGASENFGYIHTMEEQASMIKSLLDRLKLRRYVLIGHSMGGYIALELTKKHPENIRGLILQNSTAYPDSDEKILNRNRAITAVKENPTLFVKLAIPMLFSEKNRTTYQKEIKAVTSKAINTSTQGIIAALEGMKIRKNNIEVLSNPEIPKLMVIGKEDTVLDFNSLIAQTSETDVEVKIFDGGHMSHIENRAELELIYTNFFNTCR